MYNYAVSAEKRPSQLSLAINAQLAAADSAHRLLGYAQGHNGLEYHAEVRVQSQLSHMADQLFGPDHSQEDELVVFLSSGLFPEDMSNTPAPFTPPEN